MKQDKETKNKLLQSAREEFMEKGYMKASLRNICKNAGVTTGALYFFFQDKEDLFEAITKETVNSIYQIMQSHYQDESIMMDEGKMYTPIPREKEEHFEDTGVIIHQMYLHRDEVLLILTKSQGTKYESIADKFIEVTEQHYKAMAKSMEQEYPDKKVDEKFLHWLAHQQIDAFIYMITHIEKEEDAMKFIGGIVDYMMAGWYGLFISK